MILLNKILAKIRNAPNLFTQAKLVYTNPATFLTKGKWVVADAKVGIIADLSNNGFAEVHLVNGAGETIGSLHAPVGQIRIATYLEIPATRRPPDLEAAARLGYF